MTQYDEFRIINSMFNKMSNLLVQETKNTTFMNMKTTYFLFLLCFLTVISCGDEKKNTKAKDTETETETSLRDTITKADSIALAKKLDKIPHHYICYTNDDDASMQLSIAFNAASNALYVKYKGQSDSIPLVNIKEDFKNSGAYPTITQFYDEMYDGKKNGTYELTHSGNWDYAKYIREKDGEIFKFTIDHDLTIQKDNYRLTPCFE